ncbi:hypothetical protein HanIR_Chr11g0546311 [Helianthus annuus]|nr:hypothetical protein HanIR_Chr11g0546311 [Helianthus annuus]
MLIFKLFMHRMRSYSLEKLQMIYDSYRSVFVMLLDLGQAPILMFMAAESWLHQNLFWTCLIWLHAVKEPTLNIWMVLISKVQLELHMQMKENWGCGVFWKKNIIGLLEFVISFRCQCKAGPNR